MFIIVVEHKSLAVLDCFPTSKGFSFIFMLSLWLQLAWDLEQDLAHVFGCGREGAETR